MTTLSQSARRMEMTMPEHILSLSYGKDSLAYLGVIEALDWLLDAQRDGPGRAPRQKTRREGADND